MEVVVVPHGSAEYRQAVELRRSVLRLPLGLDFSQEELAGEADQIHFVLRGGMDISACLILVPQNCSVIKMRQVAVDPARQGEGLGRHLVEASEQWARGQNYSRMELHARDTAVPFYETLEYISEGEMFYEVGIPHRKMIKDLT